MNPLKSFKNLTLFEKLLWLFSFVCVIVCFLLSGKGDYLNLTASLIGVTALIFVAKGDVLGQLLSVAFAVFYGIISWKFRYYGEVATYMLMTAPIAVASVVSWLRNPYTEMEVKVGKLSVKKWIVLLLCAVAVTVVFYFVLDYFDTPNIIFGTLSVFTSFMASSLTMLRSEYYGVWYGLNDIVLIVLWVLASLKDMSYLPMVACFCVFLLNDAYGFVNWQRIKKRQNIGK